MESPACGGVASCAGQHAACLHHPRGRQQQGSALPCSLLSQWTWWASIRQIGGCVPSTGFTLKPPPVPPHPLMCVLHTGSGRQGQSPWDTVADCDGALPLCRQGKRGQRGQALFGQQEAEGTLLLTDDTTLNVWKIVFVEYRGEKQATGSETCP